MGYVTGTDSRQMTLGVWSIEDEVPWDSPARFIEVFVDSMDLEAMGFEHTIPAYTGRPPYNPYDLVKLYVWGYLNRIRSSRRLMRECHRNMPGPSWPLWRSIWIPWTRTTSAKEGSTIPSPWTWKRTTCQEWRNSKSASSSMKSA